MFTKIKGTQDFLDLTLFNFIIDQTKLYLKLYNFSEIATPILEPLELFKRSLGQETDVVTKEMYTICTSAGQEAIALRPEGTASVVRAFVNNAIEQTPWKVFSWGPMFRHERPQKGRYRQLHQVTMEIIGSSAIAQDAQFIKMLDRLFYEKLYITSSALLLNFLGCQDDMARFKALLSDQLECYKANLCSMCIDRKEKNLLRVFDCKNPVCQEIYKNAPKITDHLCASCAAEWQELQNMLQLLSISYTHVPTLVRGLDYYEKTVFEFVSSELGAQSAFCGGGRYNRLVGFIGNRKDQPSIGAGMGIDRILLLLEAHKDKLPLLVKPALSVFVPFESAQQPLALLLADELQAYGLSVDIILEGESLKSKMRKAHKLGATYVLLLGPDEQKNKKILVKNMLTGQEETISQDRLVAHLQSTLK